jgi:threonine dehydratase
MHWLYRHHGLRTEPSGAIAVAAALTRSVPVDDGEGDVVIVVSGRNVDEDRFSEWIRE